jgi:hypothetical protein
MEYAGYLSNSQRVIYNCFTWNMRFRNKNDDRGVIVLFLPDCLRDLIFIASNNLPLLILDEYLSLFSVMQ